MNEKENCLFHSNNSIYILLFSIIFIALIVRVIALMSLRESVYFDFLLWDERVYHNWAVQIAKGVVQSQTAPDFAPLPAYLMAVVYKLFSPNILYIRILNIILGVITCLLIYLIGREMLNRATGLISCLIASLYKPFIFYSIVPLKTSLSVFLFALTVYLFLIMMRKESWLTGIILGMIMGFLLNVRPNSLVLIPFIPLLILWNSFNKGAPVKRMGLILVVYTAGVFISLSPFIVNSYRDSGSIALTTPQSGYNLYLGNNLQNQEPYYNPVPFASSVPFEQGIHFTIEASRRTGKKLTRAEASGYWTRNLAGTALDYPVLFLWKLCLKTLAIFNQFERGDHYHIGFMSGFARFFKLPLPGIWLILPFGMAGMAISVKRFWKYSALIMVFVVYALTLIAFFINTRYRLPLMVIVIPFSVTGIYLIIPDIKNRRLRPVIVYLLTLIVFFIIEFIPLRGTGDMSLYYNTHAIILDSRGLEDEAIKYWKKSSDLEMPSSACADYSLAIKSILRQDIQEALAYLDRIGDDSFFSAPKYELIGDMMMHLGHTDKAISAYEKSLETNSGQRRIRQKLAKIFWGIDRTRAMEEFEKLEYLNSFYNRECDITSVSVN